MLDRSALRFVVTSARTWLPLALASVSCSALPSAPETENATLQQRADRVAAEVARIRDLELRSGVPAGMKSKDELREVMREEIDKDWSNSKGAEQERAMKLFGLLPDDYRLRDESIEFMRDQVGGYYDPVKKEFFTVADDGSSAGDEKANSKKTEAKPSDSSGDDELFVLSHELTHAVDDQHFDLDKLQKSLPKDDDRNTALTSLIEGSAMEGGIENILDRGGLPLSTSGPTLRAVVWLLSKLPWNALDSVSEEADAATKSLEASPPIMGRSLIFPYIQGWRFVNRVRAEYGWRAVNESYADPPESTEQILHPERYFDRRDRPVQIELPSAPSGWTAVFDQTLGMLGLQIYLDHNNADEDYAEGWDGDRYVLWNTGSQDVLGFVVAFDFEGQAEDFARIQRSILKSHGAPEGTYAVAQNGNLVGAVSRAPAGTAEAAALHLIANTKVHVAEGDERPDHWILDVLRFPLALQFFEKSWQWNVLDGHVLHYRNHDEGHRFHLLDGLALESESNADRNAFWAGLGLVGFAHERTVDWTFARIPFLFNLHLRGADATWRSRYGLALDALMYENERGAKTFELLWGLGCSVNWGNDDSDEPGLRILFIPIPGT